MIPVIQVIHQETNDIIAEGYAIQLLMLLRFKKSHLVKFTDNRLVWWFLANILIKRKSQTPNIKVEGLGKIIISTYLGKEAKVRVER